MTDSHAVKALDGPGAPSRMESLDALRGLAAATVVVQHLFEVIEGSRNRGVDGLGTTIRALTLTPLGFFWGGNQSVILFFVLSGFVLTRMLQQSSDSYGAYLLRRVCRLWLPYLVSLFLAASLVKLQGPMQIGGLSERSESYLQQVFSRRTLLDHVLFIGDYNTEAFNYVIWSLIAEMRVSFFFPGIHALVRSISIKQSVALSVTLSGASVLGLLLVRAAHARELETFVLTFHYAAFFVIGALVSMHLGSLQQRLSAASALQRGSLLLAAVLLYTTMQTLPAALGLPSVYLLNQVMCVPFAVLMTLYALRGGWFERVLLSEVVRYLGRISYSLYLYHAFIIIASLKLLHDRLPLLAVLAVAAVVSLTLADVSYRLVERPTIRLGRHLAAQLGRRARARA